MKKTIIALCLLILVLNFSLFAQADAETAIELSEYSATSVEKDVITELGLTDGDIVYKLYNCPVIFAFGKSAPIDEILKSRNILQTIYVVSKKNDHENKWIFYTEADGSLAKIQDILLESNTALHTALTYLTDEGPVKEFSGAKTVTNKFFFFNPTMQQGNAIYYQTEKGDFVYYDLSGTGRKLFTAEEFYAIAVNKYSEMRGNTGQGGTGSETNGNAGQGGTGAVRPETVTGPETDGGGSNAPVWILAAVFAAVAAAAVTVTLVLKKRAS